MIDDFNNYLKSLVIKLLLITSYSIIYKRIFLMLGSYMAKENKVLI